MRRYRRCGNWQEKWNETEKGNLDRNVRHHHAGHADGKILYGERTPRPSDPGTERNYSRVRACVEDRAPGGSATEKAMKEEQLSWETVVILKI